MLQYSLRNLLVAVTMVAVGTAALLNANEWWASLLWGVALVMLVFAGLAALFRRESQRAFWSGYLAAGTFYLLLLMFSYGSVTPLNHDHLITTRIMVWTYSVFPASKRSQFLPPPVPPAGGVGGMPSMGSTGGAGTMPGMPSGPGMPGGMGMPGMGGMGMGPPMARNPTYIEQEVFTEVGHALWILFLSWLGGTVAFWLVRTRERSSTAGASHRVANG